MGGQGGESGGEKVQQIDALSQVLVQSGQGGHIDQQKGAAPTPKPDRTPVAAPTSRGDQPAAHNRHLRPPQMSRAPEAPLQPREPDALEQPSSGPAAHSAAR